MWQCMYLCGHISMYGAFRNASVWGRASKRRNDRIIARFCLPNAGPSHALERWNVAVSSPRKVEGGAEVNADHVGGVLIVRRVLFGYPIRPIVEDCPEQCG